MRCARRAFHYRASSLRFLFARARAYGIARESSSRSLTFAENDVARSRCNSILSPIYIRPVYIYKTRKSPSALPHPARRGASQNVILRKSKYAVKEFFSRITFRHRPCGRERRGKRTDSLGRAQLLSARQLVTLIIAAHPSKNSTIARTIVTKYPIDVPPPGDFTTRRRPRRATSSTYIDTACEEPVHRESVFTHATGMRNSIYAVRSLLRSRVILRARARA